jgi:hypothetical protein
MKQHFYGSVLDYGVGRYTKRRSKGMRRGFAIVIIVAAITVGCTSITVKPMDAGLKPTFVCIQENPKVLVDDFLQVLKEGFGRHGIATEVFSDNRPQKCEYVLTYTALRSWDITPFLSHAELRIEKDGKEVAHAEYHLIAKGGFSLAKWDGTKEKMDPVIDELLKTP